MGRAEYSIPILKKGYLNGEIDTSRNVKTFYTAHGDLILYASVLFIAVIISMSAFDYMKRKRTGE